MNTKQDTQSTAAAGGAKQLDAPQSANEQAANLQPVSEQAAEDEEQAQRLAERVNETATFLEALRDDYASLALLPLELRERLVRAAGQLARPGPWAKRELAQAAREREAARKRAADERVLDQTGIRQSRRQRIFTPWRNGATIDRVGNRGVQPHVMAATAADPQPPTIAASSVIGADSGQASAEEAASGRTRLSEPTHCYVCKTMFQDLHFFYDALCPSCARENWEKRTPHADLRGRVAIVTGARVKIGFYCALMLLRAGAHVIVTTRFPRDAAQRYAAESDFAQWSQRLEIFGLDLRHTPSVEAFARFMISHLARLDFVINNACQTVRRPVGFYDHLMAGETKTLALLDQPARGLLAAYEQMRGHHTLDTAISNDNSNGSTTPSGGALLAAANAVGLRDPAALSQLALLEEDLDRSTHLFPTGQLDADLQQVDLRDINSWRLSLAEVSAVELLEVQLVNAVAPFILNARLKTIMLRQPNRDKHIVNVSAVEGQFSRNLKTDRHPHTNMAKAALNMMTRTSAADYLKDGIHMNSVDTGWVTDEDPAAIAARKTREHGFHPPLDIVDGAARVVDPIFSGINTGVHTWGAFLKDYRPTDW